MYVFVSEGRMLDCHSYMLSSWNKDINIIIIQYISLSTDMKMRLHCKNNTIIPGGVNNFFRFCRISNSV